MANKGDKMRLMIFSVLTILIIGCSDSSNKVNLIDPPKIDQSTPDKTVKSFLNYSAWYDSSETNLANQFFVSHKEDFYSVFIKDASDTLYAKQQNNIKSRKASIKNLPIIDNVDIQSESRAIVLVKTDEMTYGLYHSKTLEMLKYTLLKENNKWIIELIERTCNSCDGIGTRKDYSSLYSTNYKQCDICKGDGWINLIYNGK